MMFNIDKIKEATLYYQKCPKCGYDYFLVGIDTCPKCGKELRFMLLGTFKKDKETKI